MLYKDTKMFEMKFENPNFLKKQIKSYMFFDFEIV